MKYGFLYLLMITFWGCRNSGNRNDHKPSKINTDTTTKKWSSTSYKVVNLKPEILPDSVVVFKFNLRDTLFADFNCDDIIDYVFFKNSTKKTNLIIWDAKTSKESIVGNDPSFTTIGDNFDWVDMWGFTADSSTYEVLFKDDEVHGSKTVQLLCFSIVLRKEEVGGGIITYQDGVYRWIHQAD